jgi:GNAT superfamily N-acetyltransferase
MSTPAIEIVQLEAAGTYGLRREVLRNGDPDAKVTFDEDDWPGAVHLGARLDGRIVGVSSWIPRPFPGTPDTGDGIAVQLRGMATANGLRGTGVGGVLVDAGCAGCAERGARLVWARARDAALAFYERHGFVVDGDGFVDVTTQLPHHVVRRDIH